MLPPTIFPVETNPAAGRRRPPVALLAALLVVMQHDQAHATTYTVCPSGCNYTSINTAVGAQLDAGVTIEVSAGTYREEVNVNNKDGEPSSRAIIKAIGTVIIDGSDPYSNTNLWTSYSGNVYYATTADMEALPTTQVFVDDVRYKYVSGTSNSTLQAGEYGYDEVADLVYVNVGGGNPGAKAIYLGHKNRDHGFDVDNSDYLTIDGFTVLRTADKGIDIRGTSTTATESVVIKNCTSAQNWRQGIYLQFASSSKVEASEAYDNAHHGIYVVSSTSCQVLSCESYRNDDPLVPRGGRAGIRIGDSSDSTDVSDVVVDYNVVHDNEDTGIDLRGARRVLVRRNISYRNGDHGDLLPNSDTSAVSILPS